MPAGSKPGERRGGRQKGSLNKKTREKQERERLQALNKGGKTPPLAKDALEVAMFNALEHGHRLREALRSEVTKVAELKPDATEAQRDKLLRSVQDLEKRFAFWLALGGKLAADLAPYQSPRLAAIAIAAPPPEPRPGEDSRLVTVDIFDASGAKVATYSDGQRLLPAGGNGGVNGGGSKTVN